MGNYSYSRCDDDNNKTKHKYFHNHQNTNRLAENMKPSMLPKTIERPDLVWVTHSTEYAWKTFHFFWHICIGLHNVQNWIQPSEPNVPYRLHTTQTLQWQCEEEHSFCYPFKLTEYDCITASETQHGKLWKHGRGWYLPFDDNNEMRWVTNLCVWSPKWNESTKHIQFQLLETR